MTRKKVMVVFGTRPEAIKLAPVIQALRQDVQFEMQVVVTGQHREMLYQTLKTFNLSPDRDLQIMTANQTLDQIVARATEGVGALIEELHPDIVLVHGDTTSTMAASLAAYHHKVKLGHVEAGLRSFDKHNPFPEEINRTVTDAIADYCFAPTPTAQDNLLAVGVPQSRIFITGNTVVDALLQISATEHAFENIALERVDFSRKVLLLTTHRRENYTQSGIADVMRAINTLIERHEDLSVVFPTHLNPNVRAQVENTLTPNPRVHVIEPLSYRDLVMVMKRCYLILTDSGGIQEEGPTFGKPVLVLRSVTERPEGVVAGVAKLVGTDPTVIVEETERLLKPQAYARMSQSTNPYGDGTAAKKIIEILKQPL